MLRSSTWADSRIMFQRVRLVLARTFGLEHVDHAQHAVHWRPELVAHGGEELRLVLQRPLELPALLADLVDQAHILNGDRGLVGEYGREFDLLGGEGLDARARQREHADQLAVAGHRQAEHRAQPPPARDVALRFLRRGVGDRNRARAARDTDDQIVPSRRGGGGSGGQQVVLRRSRGAAAGRPAEAAVLELIDAGHLRPARGSRCRGRPAAQARGRRSSG